MRHIGLIAITSLVLLGTWAATATAVPTQVTFTGRITDTNGAINGSVNLTFEIFDAASGGTLMWDEVHTALTATNGLVYVNLGAQDPLNATVFTGAGMYLQLTVNGTPQTPRIPINSVPYATNAGTSALLGTLAPSDVALATHNHDLAYAALAHNHDAAYAALGHNHDAAYAALVHNHDAAYYTKAQSDARFAALTHTHAATDITSGTLDVARFSAYSDLGAEGYLDNNATTDLLRQSDGDGRYSLTAHTHATSDNAGRFKNATGSTFPGALVTLTITAPSAGSVFLTATAYCNINATSNLRLTIDNTTVFQYNLSNLAILDNDAAVGAQGTLAVTRVMPAVAGTNTYYANGIAFTGGGNCNGNMTGVFTPSLLP